MQVTAFKQVKNNAGGHLASLISIGGTSLVLQSGEGAKFPAPGNPFYVTVWNDTTYPDPSDDPNMEVFVCSSRTGDTLTVNTATIAHSSGSAAAILVNENNLADLNTAVNELENRTTYKGYVTVGPAGSTADYVCDGTADQTEINSAITAMMAAGGGIVDILAGTYNLSAYIDTSGNDTDMDSPPVMVRGAGTSATILKPSSGVNGIYIRRAARVHLRSFELQITGTSSGIVSTKGTTSLRSAWLSSFKDIYINVVSPTAHSGWGLDIGSMFRSTWENIEMFQVKNGLRITSEDNNFNPGDMTFNRMFIETGTTAGGTAINIHNNTANSVPNQILFLMTEMYAGGTGQTGVLLDGTNGGANIRFLGHNSEQFATCIDVQAGFGNDFECNYITSRTGGTVFKCGAGAYMNTFKAGFLDVPTGITSTVINDAGDTDTAPNKMYDTYMNVDGTANATVQPWTIIENIGGFSTGTVAEAVALGYQSKMYQTLTPGVTVNTNCGFGKNSFFKLTAGQNFTLANPTNAKSGQRITWRIKQDATGSRVMTLGSNFRFGTTLTGAVLTTGGNKVDYLTAVYDATDGKFDVVEFVKGY